MTAPGAAMALVVSLLLAKLSDRARERAVFIAIAMIGSTAGCFWLAFPPAHTSRGVLYAGYVVTVGFMGTGQAINAVRQSPGIQLIARHGCHQGWMNASALSLSPASEQPYTVQL